MLKGNLSCEHECFYNLHWSSLCSVTWQGSAHGSKGTELQFVHDTEAGALLQSHQSPAREEQGEVQGLRHDTQPQHSCEYKKQTKTGRKHNPACLKADKHACTTGLLILCLEIWMSLSRLHGFIKSGQQLLILDSLQARLAKVRFLSMSVVEVPFPTIVLKLH